jgi:16S rRNA (uracil1498-N3)-methyltransferase
VIRVLVEAAQTGQVTLSVEKSRYLAQVLRLKIGALLEAFDGRGTRFHAEVAAIEGGAVTLTLSEPRGSADARGLTLIQALPKGDKLELVLQKCTELGVAGFVLAAGEHSVAQLDAAKAPRKLARWNVIAEEASRQSGRAGVPGVSLAPSLVQAVRDGVARGAVLVLSETERERSLADAFVSLPPTAPVSLVVGPEGGFSTAEFAAMHEAGAIQVTLGHNILRTETAGLVAVTLCRFLDGRL